MSSAISNLALLEKCKEQVLNAPTGNSLDSILKDVLITANREIFELDTVPVAWARGAYDNLFTRTYAEVDDITQANPGVVDADSTDSDITGHGFTDKDIIYMAGLGDDSMDELNYRYYRVNYINSTTFSLLNVDGQYAVNTSSLDDYSSGGTIYHAGIIIPTSTICPSSGEASYRWSIGDIYAVTFDGIPVFSMSEEATLNSELLRKPGGIPKWFRYWRNNYTGFGPNDTTEHYLLFQPLGQRYNIRIFFEKNYPDLFIWTNDVYPPHPPEIHDFIWHRALANLIGNAERQKRQTNERVYGNIEIAYAQHWMLQKALDEAKILEISREMIGSKHSASSRGWSA